MKMKINEMNEHKKKIVTFDKFLIKKYKKLEGNNP